jgi:nickel-dependent lactate racemase
MRLSLNYGRGTLALEIPEKNILAYRRAVTDSIPNNQKILLEAINEFGILRISPIFAGRQVGVIIDVSTRSAPPVEALAVMLPFLRGARFVQFLIAAGSHEPDCAANQTLMAAIHAMIQDFEFPEYEIHANDGEKDEFVEAGKTARGTPVQVNERSARCDIFLIITDMQNHEFAGYTNPLQNFLPGICSLETQTRNEVLACDERAMPGAHPFHPDPQRRNNPLADDVWEGVQMILRRRPVLALTVISSQGQLQWAKIGALIEATSAGIQKVDELMRFTLPPADYLIVSPGGYPDDENLCTALRALGLTKNAVTPSGEILFLAHCENGVGPQHFYETLAKPLSEVLKNIANEYQLASHRAYKFSQRMQQLRAIHLHSNLPNDVIECIHLQPCAEPQALVNQWLTKNSQAKINIFDGANKLAIYSE